MHHDTITGTSPKNVMFKFVERYPKVVDINKQLLEEYFKMITVDDEGVFISSLNICNQIDVFARRMLCPSNVEIGSENVFMIVYNPSLNMVKYIELAADVSSLEVQKWDRGLKGFSNDTF